MKKRLCSALFAVIVMLNISPLFVSAGAELDIQLAQIEAELGSDELISVPVTAKANTGYIAGTMDFKWNKSALTLVSVDYTELAPDCNSAAINDTGTYRVSFGDNIAKQDFLGTDTMFTLNFKTTESAAAGTYDITLVKYDVINYELSHVAVTANTGSVKLYNAENCISLEADNVIADLIAGSEVRVPINASKNSGYVAGVLDVTWDKDALALKAVEYNSENAPERAPAAINNTGSYKVSFGNSTEVSDFKGKGEFFTLVFTVTETATAGNYPIGLASPTFVNNALEKVNVILKDGSVDLHNTITTTTTKKSTTTSTTSTTTKKPTTTSTTSTTTTTKKTTTTSTTSTTTTTKKTTTTSTTSTTTTTKKSTTTSTTSTTTTTKKPTTTSTTSTTTTTKKPSTTSTTSTTTTTKKPTTSTTTTTTTTKKTTTTFTTSTTTTKKPTTTSTTSTTTTTKKSTTTSTTSTTTTTKKPTTTSTTSTTTTTKKPTTTSTTSTTTTTKKPSTTSTTSTTTTTNKPINTTTTSNKTTTSSSTNTTTTTTSNPTTTTSTTTTPINYTLGDVNKDGDVNAVDASSVLAYYARISTNQEGGYDEEQEFAADVNHDGDINAVDASNILAYYAYTATTKEEIMSMEDFMKKK